MADHEPTRQRFEDLCWQHYMAERQRRDLPGDVVDEFPTREQLFWRQPGGAYGVLMFNAAWQAWCWALEGKSVQPLTLDLIDMGSVEAGYMNLDTRRAFRSGARFSEREHGILAKQAKVPTHGN